MARIQQCANEARKNKIKTALEETNLTNQGSPWCGVGPTGIKRWDSSELPIEVANPQKDIRIGPAIACINRLLRTQGTLLKEVDQIAQGEKGIVVSIGTAVGRAGQDPLSVFGNVSKEPRNGAYPQGFAINGYIRKTLYVNLDSTAVLPNGGHVSVRASPEHVIHEFGHALGMGEHFNGFGKDNTQDVISLLFWQVLVTIYSNPIGCEEPDIQAFVLGRRWSQEVHQGVRAMKLAISVARVKHRVVGWFGGRWRKR